MGITLAKGAVARATATAARRCGVRSRSSTWMVSGLLRYTFNFFVPRRGAYFVCVFTDTIQIVHTLVHYVAVYYV